jgi:DNA invertase Pin-like site-specific DNA recombinase
MSGGSPLSTCNVLTNTTAKAFSYLRFSTPEQAAGDSFRRQIASARTYADENNLQLDESLKDRGISAFKGKHRDEKAALGAFLRRVQEGDVPIGSFLLVESLDRLSREEVLDALELFLSLTRSGITIVTLTDKRVYSRESLRLDYTQLLISIISMSRAHEESLMKSERVAEAWKAKRKLAQTTGQAMTAQAPAWLRLDGGPKLGKYAPIEDRATIVQQIFRDTISGIGRSTIAKRLNSEKVPTWGAGKRKGKYWHESYIQKILSNPAVYGTYRSVRSLAGEAPYVIENYFPCIVSEDTFWRAKAASAARGSGNGRTGLRKNLLSRIVQCYACSNTMVLIEKGKRSAGPKLRCGNAHAAAGCQHRDYYTYARIELGVIMGLGSQINALVDGANDRASESRETLNAGKAKLNSVSNELDNLIDVARSTGLGKTIAAAISKLEAEKEQLQLEVSNLSQEAEFAKRDDKQENIVRIKELYGSLSLQRGDELLRSRGFIQQRLKMIVRDVKIGPSGFVASFFDGKTAKMFFPNRAS